MDEKKSLNELLEQATSENCEKLVSVAAPVFEPKQETPPLSTVIARPEEKLPSDEPLINLDAEAQELIERYSQKPREEADSKSSTGSLRDSLNAQMEKDKELLKYYKTGSITHRNSKVNELYTIINDTSGTLAAKQDTAVSRSAHFSDPEDIPKMPVFKQQKLFFPDDTATIELEQESASASDKDSEYDELGNKILSGEINFAEDTDDSQLTFADTEQIGASSESQQRDKKDIDLLLALNMMDSDSDEVSEELRDIYNNKGVKKEKGKKQKTEKQDAAPFEYKDREQNAEISELLRRAISKSRLKLVFSVIIALAVLYLELASPDSALHPAFLRPGRYGTLYALVDLQLLFLMVITLLDSVVKGCVGLFTRKPSAETILFVSSTVAAAYTAVTAFIDPSAESFGMFCFPAAVCGVVCAFIKYLQCIKDNNCFNTVSSKSPKFVAEKLDNTAREGTAFYEYLLEDSRLYTVKRTTFVDGFFRRLNTRPEGEDLFGFLSAVVIIAGAALFGLQLYLGKPIYEAFAMFTKCVMFCLPFSAFFIISLPVITANYRAKRCGSAFIGNAVGEEYSEAAVISFADTEVFPSSLVKITSIRVFGELGIDRIIYDLAKVFDFLGGPLKKVTRDVLSGQDISYNSARIIESASDGVCAVIDGNEMFLGKKSYMRRYRFETPYDDGDEKFEDGNGSIMYVTSGDKLIAKVYIRYTISNQFNNLLKNLYKAGMCVGIKTVDPNINTALMERTVRFKKCPISILKSGDVHDVEGTSERIDSGVVTTASLHTFLKMFIVCDKIRHVTKSNGIINVLSVALSFFVVFFLAFTGGLAGIQSYYPVLYQLLWLLPIGVISLLL